MLNRIKKHCNFKPKIKLIIIIYSKCKLNFSDCYPNVNKLDFEMKNQITNEDIE